MPGAIATIPKFMFSANGVPMVGGTLTVYIAGTTTPTNTWQDQALGSANTNPITLDARGECVLWLDSTKSYKFVLANASGVTQWTQDNISGAQVASFATDLAAANGASLVGGANQVVASITALRALLKTSASKNALTTGYYAAGDGGGGAYWYDASDTTTADNGGSVIVATDGGRWKLAGTAKPTFKQLGAKADAGGANTNCAPVLQSYLTTGGAMTIGDGTYYFSTPSSVTYGAIAQNGNPSKRYAIEGESINNTNLWYAGTGAWLTSEGGYGTAGMVALDTIKNLSLTSVNVYNNNGIYYSQKAYSDIENVYLAGFNQALTLNACFTSSIRNLYVANNNYGLSLTGAAFPDSPNALTMRRVTFHLNRNLGLYFQSVGNGNVLDGFTCESNGTMGDANTGGMLLNIANANNGGALRIANGYFEINKGGFDISINNSQPGRAVVELDNLFFNRAESANFTTYNIKLTNTGAGSLVVVMKGCNFLSGGSYVPNAARPFLSIGAGCEVIDGGGNVYSELTSLPNNPTARPGLSSEIYCGDVALSGAVNSAPNGVTVARTSAGVYELTHALGWGVDANAYVPVAVSSDNTGGLTVQRVNKNNTNVFTVVTVNGAGALTDCPFFFHVVRIA